MASFEWESCSDYEDTFGHSLDRLHPIGFAPGKQEQDQVWIWFQDFDFEAELQVV